MLNGLLLNSKTLNVNLRIPKFNIAQTTDLIPPLMNLGVKRAFNATEASLADISPETTYISNMKQGCSISIDEEGVTAATTTLAEGTITLTNIEDGGNLYFDHPFLFAVTEESSGAILFMGKIGKL